MRQTSQDQELRELFLEAGRAEEAPPVRRVLAAAKERPRPVAPLRTPLFVGALGALALFLWFVLPYLAKDSSPRGERAAQLAAVSPEKTKDARSAQLPPPKEALRVSLGAGESSATQPSTSSPSTTSPSESGTTLPSASQLAKTGAAADLERCLAAKNRGEIDKAMEHCALVPGWSEEGKAALAEISAVKAAYKARHQKIALLALSRDDEKSLKSAAREISLLEKYIGPSDAEVTALTTLYKTLRGAKPSAGAPHKGPVSAAEVKELIREAMDLAAQKRHGEALVKLDEAKRVAPATAEIYYIEGSIYSSKGKVEKACKSFKRHLKLAPSGSKAANAKRYMKRQNPIVYPSCKL